MENEGSSQLALTGSQGSASPLLSVSSVRFAVALPCLSILTWLKGYVSQGSFNSVPLFQSVLILSLRVSLHLSRALCMWRDHLALNVFVAKLSCMERQLYLLRL